MMLVRVSVRCATTQRLTCRSIEVASPWVSTLWVSLAKTSVAAPVTRAALTARTISCLVGERPASRLRTRRNQRGGIDAWLVDNDGRGLVLLGDAQEDDHREDRAEEDDAGPGRPEPDAPGRVVDVIGRHEVADRCSER